MKLTPGKLWGLRRMADSQGRFKMTAVDQRPPIKNPIAAHYQVDVAPYADVARVKAQLIDALQGPSSALLLDPHFAIPAGIDLMDPSKGLIVTLEDSQFEETPLGRLSGEIDDWSVEKIKRMGADAVKVLAWYRPDASTEVCQHQEDFVRRIGDECRRVDIPHLLELLVYPLPGDGGQTSDYLEMPAKKADHVLASVAEFANPDYGVDVFKLESPVNAAAVPTLGEADSSSVQGLFDEMGRLAGRPWVMLSAGAGKDEFRNILAHAYRAGASGYLAGRAIWLDAFAEFPDWQAMASKLNGDSVDYMQDINRLTDAGATPFADHPCFAASPASFSPPDGSFRHLYDSMKARP